VWVVVALPRWRDGGIYLFIQISFRAGPRFVEARFDSVGFRRLGGGEGNGCWEGGERACKGDLRKWFISNWGRVNVSRGRKYYQALHPCIAQTIVGHFIWNNPCFNVPEDSVLSSLSTSIIPSNLETIRVTRDLDVPDELEALFSFYILDVLYIASAFWNSMGSLFGENWGVSRIRFGIFQASLNIWVARDIDIPQGLEVL
jgi:hypothetical protein